MRKNVDVCDSYRSDGYDYSDYTLNMIQSGDMNRDGRCPWMCEYCKKLQHPDHEMTRSIYYQFSNRDGPFFCGIQCMYGYRDHNDQFRFASETSVNQSSKIKKTKKQWKLSLKKSVENVLNSGDQKLQQQVLDAIHVANVIGEDTSE